MGAIEFKAVHSGWFDDSVTVAVRQPETTDGPLVVEVRRGGVLLVRDVDYTIGPWPIPNTALPALDAKLRHPVDRDSNPHKAHLARGAQWKRERGRRR